MNMTKERRNRSMSFDRCRRSPLSCSSSRSSKIDSETEENLKEWEDARCPVCMEHPHNAILLICSSHEKGCRPYMCDTSYRHSNCFDQFRKSSTDTSETAQQDPYHEGAQLVTTNLSPAAPADSVSTAIDLLEERTMEGLLNPSNDLSENQVLSKLVCPLCRGKIIDWVVVEPACCFMNAKSRSCASESCNFTGASRKNSAIAIL